MYLLHNTQISRRGDVTNESNEAQSHGLFGRKTNNAGANPRFNSCARYVAGSSDIDVNSAIGATRLGAIAFRNAQFHGHGARDAVPVSGD